MKQYLIKHITHDTGETFVDILEVKDNEMFTVVEAESKEEAKEKYEAQVKIRRDGDAKENGND
ncbi:TPA: DUF1381 domain-containing protein [Staphylococcus aureus]|nr:DUF1381 domain-containing protein [Staphylococcus aureus]HDK3925034.1 DUF1381 domain-containing protein [Staphylococcus aureus]